MPYYIIKSKMNGLVLDIKDECCGNGGEIIMWTPKEDDDNDNQLWWMDDINEPGTIKSKLTECTRGIDIEEANQDKGAKVCTWESDDSKSWQKWCVEETGDGKVIKSEFNGLVLDIFNENEDKGAEVGTWEYSGGANQRWDFIEV